MGNGLYRINWPGIHFDRRTEVYPTVLRDVTTAVSDSEAHAVEHAEVGDRSGTKRYIITIYILPKARFFGLHFRCRQHESNVNHFDVIDPQQYRIR